MTVMRLARRMRQEDTTLDGITMSQLSALAVVERDGPLTIGRLAEAERVQPPTMTKMVARLEELGWVERCADPEDRRHVVLVATEAGRQRLAESRQQRTAFLASRLDRLSADDQAQLERAATILERLLAEE
jgi:DNA-binding MarR family transcriptional regulator